MEVCCNMKKDYLFNFECASSSTYSGLVRGGTRFAAGTFPFLVALVYTLDAKFFCGGSLITDKHVLTAAHCIRNKGTAKELHPEDVLVLLGRHNIALPAEPKARSREVEEIMIHEDWKSHGYKYDADLAILLMESSVKFSLTIKPICLPGSGISLSIGKGTVVNIYCKIISSYRKFTACSPLGRVGEE